MCERVWTRSTLLNKMRFSSAVDSSANFRQLSLIDFH